MEDRAKQDEYFLKMAFLVAERSTCLRRHVGAVVVHEKQVVSTGCNCSEQEAENCNLLGCIREELNIKSGTQHEICRAIHAEQKAIIQAPLKEKVFGSIIYCTHSPCAACAKIIAYSKISEFVYCYAYPDQMFVKIFEEAKIKTRKLEEPKLIISKKE